MKNFEYCIWLVSNKDTWKHSEKEFRTHMTIKSNLSLNEAKKIYKNINKSQYILKINSDLLYSVQDNFHALYYNVICKNDKPLWWPSDAHVSFKYNYDIDFSNEDKQFNINNKECLFNDIIIMNCNNHYTNWYQITDDI